MENPILDALFTAIAKQRYPKDGYTAPEKLRNEIVTEWLNTHFAEALQTANTLNQSIRGMEGGTP